jgi:HEAT repeat protein
MQDCSAAQVEQYISDFRDFQKQDEYAIKPLVTTCGSTAIQALIKVLNNEPNPGVRYRAAAALGYIGGITPISPLIVSLTNDPNPLVRKTAADALGTIQSPKALPILISKLSQSNEDRYVRESAATSLGDIGGELAIRQLIAVLQNKNESLDLRLAAAKSLARIGDPATGSLASSLQNTDLRTQYWATMALVEINSSQSLNILTLNQKKVNQILEAAKAANIIESYRVPVKEAIQGARNQLANKPIICQIPWIYKYWGRCQ